MTKLQEKANEFAAKQKKLDEVFAQAGADRDFNKVTCLGDGVKTDSDKVKKVHEMSAELNDLMDQVKALQDIEKTAGRAKSFQDLNGQVEQFDKPEGPGEEIKSIGRQFVESAAYKAHIKDGRYDGQNFNMELKPPTKAYGDNTFSNASWVPQSIRTPGLVIPYATRPIQVIDLIPPGQTTQLNVKYMEETTFTNAAAETAELGTYPEAALALSERAKIVEKIAVYLPVTDEQLADVPQAESYINQRLPFMLRQRLDYQVQLGNGVTPNLLGIMSTPSVQTYNQAGGDSSEDAIFKAITKVMFTGYAFPNAVVFNPNDWQTIRLHRTTQGVYIWGNPSEAGPNRIWGLPIALSTALTATNAIIADFANFTQLFERSGIDVQVGYVNDDFIKGRRAIRADVRVCMVVYRPAAICLAESLA